MEKQKHKLIYAIFAAVVIGVIFLGAFIINEKSSGNAENAMAGGVTGGAIISIKDAIDPQGSTIIPADFDGDSKADIVVSNPATGKISVKNSSGGGVWTFAYGAPGWKPAIADYDGDRKADFSWFIPSTTIWRIYESSNGYAERLPRQTIGGSGDTPVPADFDGDSKADLAVFRKSSGKIWVNYSSTGELVTSANGNPAWAPAIADYDGDSKADFSWFIPSTTIWRIYESSNGYAEKLPRQKIGSSKDIPIPADFDGDSKADIAVLRKSSGKIWVMDSSGKEVHVLPYGSPDWKPAVADYDGDSKADVAFITSTGELRVYSKNLGENSGLSEKQIASEGIAVHSTNQVYFQDKNGNPIYFVGTYATSLGKGVLPGSWSYALNRTAGKSNYVRYQVYFVDLADSYYNPNCGMLTPWKRVSGAGKTSAGLCNKFDLTQFDANYFTDMKSYIAEAEKKGIYVHISLFDEIFVEARSGGLGFDRNPFGNGNHINTGLIGNVDRNSDGSGMGSDEFYDVQALKGKTADSKRLALARLQKAYVKKVINETKGFSNVFYEVGNEVTDEAWTNYWVNFIKNRTAHPVTINCFFGCLKSGAQDGAVAHAVNFDGAKLMPGVYRSNFDRWILLGLDTDGDDSAGNPDNNRKAAWLAFVSGYGLYGDYGEYISETDFNREQMYFGYLVKFIKDSGIRFELMSAALCGGKNCLANAGKEYVVYSTSGGTYSIDLSAIPVSTIFTVRWYNPVTGEFSYAGTAKGGAIRNFNAPFSGEAVLYVLIQSSPSLKKGHHTRTIIAV